MSYHAAYATTLQGTIFLLVSGQLAPFAFDTSGGRMSLDAAVVANDLFVGTIVGFVALAKTVATLGAVGIQVARLEAIVADVLRTVRSFVSPNPALVANGAGTRTIQALVSLSPAFFAQLLNDAFRAFRRFVPLLSAFMACDFDGTLRRQMSRDSAFEAGDGGTFRRFVSRDAAPVTLARAIGRFVPRQRTLVTLARAIRRFVARQRTLVTNDVGVRVEFRRLSGAVGGLMSRQMTFVTNDTGNFGTSPRYVAQFHAFEASDLRTFFAYVTVIFAVAAKNALVSLVLETAAFAATAGRE